MESKHLLIVLDRPQNPANIGAVVRALRNFGFSELRLVNPVPFERTELLRYAHRCEELVAGMTIHATLDDALRDAVYVVGTAAQAHPDRPHTRNVHALAQDMAQRSSVGRVALLFGTEGDGLDRAALDRCHLVASLPTNAAYPALNLAQSVLLFLYELRQALDHDPVDAPTPQTSATDNGAPATHADLERIFATTLALLERTGYIRYSPEALMRTLRQITYRTELTEREAGILMSVMRTLARNLPSDAPE